MKAGQTICWGCQRAVGACSWSSKKHKPVQGWDADMTILKLGVNRQAVSFIVRNCPLFIADKKRKKVKYEKEDLI